MPGLSVSAGMTPAGFFANPPVQLALSVGGLVAVCCAVLGVFTVIRGQSFAAHALADIGAAGGAAAVLLGFAPLTGFLAFTVAGAAAVELIGVQRARSRDVATGVVLGAGLGLTALLLYWDTTASSTTGAAITILFGSLFSLHPALLAPVTALAGAAVALTLALARPLLLVAVHPDLAAAQRIPVRLLGLGYLFALALAVALAAVSVGAILSTALLIGPAATALRLTARLPLALLIAAVLGVAATWVGVLLAYVSFSWPPAGHGWPVSFFIVTVLFSGYLLAGLAPTFRRARTSSLGRYRCPVGPQLEGHRACSPTT